MTDLIQRADTKQSHQDVSLGAVVENVSPVNILLFPDLVFPLESESTAIFLHTHDFCSVEGCRLGVLCQNLLALRVVGKRRAKRWDGDECGRGSPVDLTRCTSLVGLGILDVVADYTSTRSAVDQ